MDSVPSRPLYLFARPRTWSRWGKALPEWSLQALTGLKEQKSPQLVLVEWEMASERRVYLFHEYGLRNHRILVVVRSAHEETEVLKSGFGDDVCREDQLGEQLGPRWERLHRLSQRTGGDVLTGLMDRRSSLTFLEEEFGRPSLESLWLVLFDLDNFKRVNDTYGHFAGDQVLVGVADQLLRRFVDAPVVCRFGGEEFLVALKMGREEVRERIDAFLSSLGEVRAPDGTAITISGGLGLRREGEGLQDLLARVDLYLYNAKAKGRNRLVDEDEFEGNTSESPLDAVVLDFENRVKVYADRLVSSLTSRGRKMVEAHREEADHDGLTGLFNRRYLDRRLDREIERSRKLKTPLTLLLLDLDDFGAVNRNFGFPAGDRALRSAAEVVLKAIRVVDWAGRYGGEELCAVFPDTEAATALVIAERVRVALEALDLAGVDGRKFRITGSFGVVSLVDSDASADHLIQRVGQAVRAAKAAGKNRISLGT